MDDTQPKPKSRRGKAVKPAKGEPAQFVPAGPFDPKALAERLDLWWQKGRDTYLRPSPNGEDWLPEPGKSVNRLLRLQGCQRIAGKPYSEADQVIQYVHDHRHVVFAGPIAGKRAGVHLLDDGRPVIATSSFKLIEPRQGDWPLHFAFMEGLLKTEEQDQRPWLFAWLKTARAALRAGITRPAPWLVLAGPSNCGKSFLQSSVITPMLGGRAADPRDWMFERTQHNAEVIGAEHLMMEELPGSFSGEVRGALGERMKQVAVNHAQRWRGMHQDGFMLPVFWRASLSINNTVEKLKMLPSLSSDFANKLILLLCNANAMPIPTDSDEGWKEFESEIAAERAAFAYFLDHEFQIPPELLRTDDRKRYGFDVFHHPELLSALFDQDPTSTFLWMIDTEIFTQKYDQLGVKCDSLNGPDKTKPCREHSEPWGWGSHQRLEEILRERFPGKKTEKLFDRPNPAALFLGKLRDKFPNRFEHRHTNAGNFWMIYPPV